MQKLLRVGLAAIVAAGCENEFRSLHPIALPSDTVGETRLVGQWVHVLRQREGFESAFVVILPSEVPGQYRVAVIDSSAPIGSWHMAHLTRIGGRLVLDVWEDGGERDDPGLRMSLHTPVYVEMPAPDTLVLLELVSDSFAATLERQPESLRHTRVKPRASTGERFLVVRAERADTIFGDLRNTTGSPQELLVVTAPTADIGAFLAAYQQRNGVLKEAARMWRMR